MFYEKFATNDRDTFGRTKVSDSNSDAFAGSQFGTLNSGSQASQKLDRNRGPGSSVGFDKFVK